MWWFVIGTVAVVIVIVLGIYTFVKNRKEEKIYEE